MGQHWYQGTADAIYQNIYTLDKTRPRWVIVLAGDHVYRMNYCDMLASHLAHEAELTIACLKLPRADASRFGVLSVDSTARIVDFNEKPHDPDPMPDGADRSLISMGIYIFDTTTLVRRVIEDAKHNTSHDFGKDIIPQMVKTDRVFAYDFGSDGSEGDGPKYWRDIGTIEAYWEANMDLTEAAPQFDLHDTTWPIRTYQEQHPPAKTVFAGAAHGKHYGAALNSLVSPGCIINGATIEHSVLSPAVRVNSGSEIVESVLMEGVEVGRNVRIRQAIIDKEVQIRDGAAIGYDHDADTRRFTVTDSGIVVVPKGVPVEP